MAEYSEIHNEQTNLLTPEAFSANKSETPENGLQSMIREMSFR
jgi:hypothetical protein